MWGNLINWVYAQEPWLDSRVHGRLSLTARRGRFIYEKASGWSDGQPPDADDVVFHVERRHLPTPNRHVWVDQFRIGGKDFQVTKVNDFNPCG